MKLPLLVTFLSDIIKLMSGVVLPKNTSCNDVFVDINDSIKNLEFYGNSYDKKNLKKDCESLGNDFKKCTKEAELKFELSL